MPDRRKSTCTCVPQEIRDIQRACFAVQVELLALEDRLEASRQSIALPKEAPAIWNGEAPPTVEVEVHGALSVLVDDYLPEMRGLLQRAATATLRSVSTEWNRIQYQAAVDRQERSAGEMRAQRDQPIGF